MRFLQSESEVYIGILPEKSIFFFFFHFNYFISQCKFSFLNICRSSCNLEYNNKWIRTYSKHSTIIKANHNTG